MKEIKLTQGKVALVDDEYYEVLNQFKWRVTNNNKNLCYAFRTISFYKDGLTRQKMIFMHSCILKTPKGLEIDHKNHNGLDNRIENIRIVTHRENMLNRRDKAKYAGVKKDGLRYVAAIMVNGKIKRLGRFFTAMEAEMRYWEEADRLIKEEKILKGFNL